MAMLQLHNRAMNGSSSHGNDFLTAITQGLLNQSTLSPFPRQASLKVDLTDGQSSALNMAKMTDLADIQSIISLTKSGNHLNQLASSGSDKLSSLNNISPTPTDRSSDEFNFTCEEKSPINSSDGQLMVDDKVSGTEFRCTVCSASFTSTTALKRHSRSHVSGGHNYTCHLCPYTSLDKSTLVRHLRTHNGERPFQCAICKYAFTTKANCERHVRKRHRKTSQAEISQALTFSEHSANSNLTVQNLNRHNNGQTDQGSIPDLYKPSSKDTFCKLCSVDFKFDRVLRHHMKAVHAVNLSMVLMAKVSKDQPFMRVHTIRNRTIRNRTIRNTIRNRTVVPFASLDSVLRTTVFDMSANNIQVSRIKIQPFLSMDPPFQVKAILIDREMKVFLRFAAIHFNRTNRGNDGIMSHGNDGITPAHSGQQW